MVRQASCPSLLSSVSGPGRAARPALAVVFLGGALLVLPWASVWAQVDIKVEIGGSPNPVGSGARALGQGNAFTAVADDATAASWNPAGLMQLERPEVSFAVEANQTTTGLSGPVGFRAHDSYSSTDGAELNYLSAVYPIYWGRSLVLSQSWLRQYDFSRELEFRLDTPIAAGAITGQVQHDYSFRQEGSLSAVTPALAVDVTPGLALGMAVNVWNHDTTGASAYTTTDLDRGSLAVNFPGGVTLAGSYQFSDRHRFEVDSGYSLVLGGLYRPSPQWAFGAVAKPGFSLYLDHEYTTTYAPEPPLAGGYTVQGQNEAELTMPLVLGLGAAWRPRDAWTVSSDLTWTDWSSYGLEVSGMENNPVTGRPAGEGELRDAYTLRVGTEYLVLRPRFIVPLRCGVGYDPSPAVGAVDDYYTINFGTGLQVGPVAFDVGYEYRWGREVNSDGLASLRAHEDRERHRVLVSLIVYF